MKSGCFPQLDKQNGMWSSTMEKGFYINSFHVDVDTLMSAFRKLRIEGSFYTLSNGGCISYVELKKAPLHNIEALEDLISLGTEKSVRYLGINFPLDICNHRGAQGVFDKCPE